MLPSPSTSSEAIPIPIFVPSSHRLPVELLLRILHLSADGSSSQHARLLTLGTQIYLFLLPALYARVSLYSASRLLAFERTLYGSAVADSPQAFASATPTPEETGHEHTEAETSSHAAPELGTLVRSLWIGAQDLERLPTGMGSWDRRDVARKVRRILSACACTPRAYLDGRGPGCQGDDKQGSSSGGHHGRLSSLRHSLLRDISARSEHGGVEKCTLWSLALEPSLLFLLPRPSSGTRTGSFPSPEPIAHLAPRALLTSASSRYLSLLLRRSTAGSAGSAPASASVGAEVGDGGAPEPEWEDSKDQAAGAGAGYTSRLRVIHLTNALQRPNRIREGSQDLMGQPIRPIPGPSGRGARDAAQHSSTSTRKISSSDGSHATNAEDLVGQSARPPPPPPWATDPTASRSALTWPGADPSDRSASSRRNDANQPESEHAYPAHALPPDPLPAMRLPMPHPGMVIQQLKLVSFANEVRVLLNATRNDVEANANLNGNGETTPATAATTTSSSSSSSSDGLPLHPAPHFIVSGPSEWGLSALPSRLDSDVKRGQLSAKERARVTVKILSLPVGSEDEGGEEEEEEEEEEGQHENERSKPDDAERNTTWAWRQWCDCDHDRRAGFEFEFEDGGRRAGNPDGRGYGASALWDS